MTSKLNLKGSDMASGALIRFLINEKFISNSSDLNSLNYNALNQDTQKTPLITACEQGLTEIVEELLSIEEVVPNKTDQLESEIIQSSEENEDFVQEQLLTGKVFSNIYLCKSPPLFWAMEYPEIVALLLLKGADPNVEDFHGNTAVLVASSSFKRTQSLPVILSSKPNTLNSCNKMGVSPAWMANINSNYFALIFLHRAKYKDINDPAESPNYSGQLVNIKLSTAAAKMLKFRPDINKLKVVYFLCNNNLVDYTDGDSDYKFIDSLLGTNIEPLSSEERDLYYETTSLSLIQIANDIITKNPFDFHQLNINNFKEYLKFLAEVVEEYSYIPTVQKDILDLIYKEFFIDILKCITQRISTEVLESDVLLNLFIEESKKEAYEYFQFINSDSSSQDENPQQSFEKLFSNSLKLSIIRHRNINRYNLDETVVSFLENECQNDSCDIDSPDETGLTPLMHAAILDRSDICAKLVLAGTDIIKTQKPNNKTALHLSTSCDNTKSTLAILEVAMQYDRAKLLLCLDSTDNSGYTPLMYAIYNGNRDTVTTIISIFAPANSPRYSIPPLYFAIYFLQIDIANDLLNSEAKLDIDMNGIKLLDKIIGGIILNSTQAQPDSDKAPHILYTTEHLTFLSDLLFFYAQRIYKNFLNNDAFKSLNKDEQKSNFLAHMTSLGNYDISKLILEKAACKALVNVQSYSNLRHENNDSEVVNQCQPAFSRFQKLAKENIKSNLVAKSERRNMFRKSLHY